MTAAVSVESLLEEAAEWRLIDLLLQCPSASARQQITALAREVQDPELSAAAEHAGREAAEGAFHSIFGPGGPAPGREASYQGTIQLGQLMSELKAYYDAFAYTPASSEPLDHVSVEAGFLGFLRLKQAYALDRGYESEATIAAEAAANFVREHLANIAEPLSAALDDSGEPYLGLTGKALLRRVGPHPKQMFDILDEATAASEAAFECGP